MNQVTDIALSLGQGSLAERLAGLLSSGAAGSEQAYSLDELSLQLGIPLPELAQTATFWQRGDLGRVLRRLGYRIQVEYRRVIFLRC